MNLIIRVRITVLPIYFIIAKLKDYNKSNSVVLIHITRHLHIVGHVTTCLNRTITFSEIMSNETFDCYRSDRFLHLLIILQCISHILPLLSTDFTHIPTLSSLSSPLSTHFTPVHSPIWFPYEVNNSSMNLQCYTTCVSQWSLSSVPSSSSPSIHLLPCPSSVSASITVTSWKTKN